MNPSGSPARVGHRSQGSALIAVMVFLAIVGVVAITVSYQSSSVRRSNYKSHYGFEAVEVAESAINEAAVQVGMAHVFPTATFPDLQAFFNAIANDTPNLDTVYSNYHFYYRTSTSG